MQLLTRIFSCALLGWLSLSHAEVYTWINEDGVRVYGDEPPPSAQKADLPYIQSIPKDVFSGESRQKKEEAKDKDEDDFAGYKSFKVLSPESDHTINFGDSGSLTVELAIKPDLEPGHEVTLFLNGKQVSSGAQTFFQLKNLDRGSYLVHAHVKNKGTMLISTSKRRFHVQRASIRSQ